MKNKILLLMMLAFVPLAQAQNQWRLEAFLEYFGHVQSSLLGSRVKGFVGSYSNNPYNAAVASSPFNNNPTGLNFYSISTPQDTTPLWVIPNGADVEHGDFNGDSYTDLAVWKSVNMGRSDTVLIYLGNVNGIDTIPTLKLLEEKPRTSFGFRMCIGDLNNDRIDDLVITAPSYYLDFFGQDYGKVYIYFGDPSMKATPDITIIGSHSGARLGTNCSIGDFNADGFNDLAIRGYDVSMQQSFFGYLNIYFGSAQFDTIPDLTGPKSYHSNTTEALAAFDINGDVKSDLLWTFKDSLTTKLSVFIHYGGKDFQQSFQIKPDFAIPAPLGSGDFGNEICDAGDMNGDGDNDLVIGAYTTGQLNGIVFVYSGGEALDDRFDAARGQTLEGGFGLSVSSVGDINHDGFSDIIIGAPNQPWHRGNGYFGIFLGDSRIPTNVEAENSEKTPKDFHLNAGYPNPFDRKTIFEFSLSRKAMIEIKVFNILGKEVKTLLYDEYAPGKYKVVWNGNNDKNETVPNGIYFCRMRAMTRNGSQPIFERVQKFTVVK